MNVIIAPSVALENVPSKWACTLFGYSRMHWIVSGVCQRSLLAKWLPIAVAFERMIEVQQPVGHVDPVDHQVGEQPAAEIPEPAPVPEPVFVERLVGRVTEEVLPGHLTGIDARRLAPKPRRAAAVPAQVDLENLADPPGLDQLARFLDVRHAALLHADLDDLLVPVLGLDDRRAFGRDRASAAFRRRRPCRRCSASTAIGTCQWSGLAIKTASMSLRSSSSR